MIPLNIGLLVISLQSQAHLECECNVFNALSCAGVRIETLSDAMPEGPEMLLLHMQQLVLGSVDISVAIT